VPTQPAWLDKLAEKAGDVAEDAALLPVLRAVLEDNPLVVKIDWVGDDDVDFSVRGAKSRADLLIRQGGIAP
jgi:hypothetical protein